jgi:putative membrane protein
MAIVSDADKARITDAIRRAESATSGEIFCVVARRSGNYHLVPLAWAALLALIVPFPLIHYTFWPASVIYLIQLAAFIGAVIGLSHPTIRFRIVPRRAKHERAHAEAVRQFLAHGLNRTERRTGVLIFASEAERYAEIVADVGINAKVTPETWQDAVAALTAGIGQGRAGDGFITAIEKCGAVLAQHFPPGALNRDELTNKLVEI